MSKSVSMLFLFLLACVQPALAAPPGVTFGAGNHLNMSGNRINNLEMAATPADKDAVNVAYVKALETRVAALEANNSVLETRLSALETLLEHFSRDGDQIVITGANLHLRSGAGSTDAAPNGLGNVIIGYDEARQSGNSSCSLGQYDNETDCTSNGGTWALNHKSGSHNLVVGTSHNYSRYGGLVAGLRNTISGASSAVSGGYGNTASGNYSAVSGGARNTASGYSSAVSGGRYNTASGISSAVSGGYANTASGIYSAVSGGGGNNASGNYSAVSGGARNTASGYSSAVSGGVNRSVSGDNDWRAGGLFEDD